MNAKEKEKIESQKHKLAYLSYKSGMRTDEIATHLGVSRGTIIKWRSNDLACKCPYHNWKILDTIDTEVNHRRAYALFGAGHGEKEIASGLGIPFDLVKAWSEEYPCVCGCHNWHVKKPTTTTILDEAPIADIDIPKVSQSLATLPNTSVPEAQIMSLHVILQALSLSVEKQDVVPRSWKDVLDTIKTVSEIVSNLNPSSNIQPNQKAKFVRTESYEIPTEDSAQEKTIQLADQLKQVALGGLNIKGK